MGTNALHVHSLVPDGLFVPADDGLLTFVPLPPPTDEDIAALALKIARRLTTVIERHCDDACETDSLLAQTTAALQQALAVAVRAPVSPTQLGLAGQEDPQPPPKPLCARVAGFSLHAAQSVAAGTARPSSAYAATACARPLPRTACRCERMAASSIICVAPGLTAKPPNCPKNGDHL